MTQATTRRAASSVAVAANFAVLALLVSVPAAGHQERQNRTGNSPDPRDTVAEHSSLQPSSQRGAGNRDVIAMVEEKLAGIEGLDAEDVRVSLDDGMVALSGQVENILMHDLAIRAATTVRGVRAIDDNLSVRPSDHSDRQIEREVETALALDPATEHWEIDALVSDGQVSLRGSVESLAEKSLASRVAKSVRGVRGVENDIVIDYPADRTDEQIAHDVTQLLRWNTTVAAESIRIDVEDDVVTLSGQVDSLYEKQHAARLAEVVGVKEVDTSNLEVRWTEDGGDEATRGSDRELTQAVRMALSLDPRIDAFEPNIEVENGVVTLTGTVDSLDAKLVAGDAARDTLGVETVRNRLEVNPPDVPDEQLAERVSDALQRSPYVSDAKIEVNAVDGEVYLEGEVDSWFERYVVGDAAAHVIGVIEVHNNVDVDEDLIG